MTHKKPAIHETVKEKKGGGWCLTRMIESISEAKALSRYLDHLSGRHQLKHHLKRSRFVGRVWDDVEKCLEASGEKHDKTQKVFEECLAGLRGVNFPVPQGIKRRARIREDGERLDLQRLRDGDPFRYWQTPRVKLPGGHSTIVVAQNYSVDCGKKPWNVAWRGAAGAAICKLLTEAGYNVEYWMYTRTTGCFKGGGDLEQAICIKAANAAPNWVKVANLTSCWAFRTLCFSLYASEQERPDGTIFDGGREGLGYPSTQWSDLEFLQGDILKGRPVVHIEGEPFSKEKAIKEVTRAVGHFSETYK